MADLAEKVGLRKASLFHHFASKDQLRRAVLERLVQRVSAIIGDGTAGSANFVQQLDTLTDAIVSMFGEQPYAARLLVREMMEWGAASGGALREALTESMALSEKFLAAGQQAGAIREGDPKQFILSMMGIHLLPFAVGGLMEQFTGHAPWSAEFIDARRKAVREQIRALVLKP